MPKHTKTLSTPSAGQPDAANPEWTSEKFARAKRLNALPSALQQALVRPTRGPQKAPTKTLVSLRLSADVLAALRATGKGWQTTVDDTLRRTFLKSGR